MKSQFELERFGVCLSRRKLVWLRDELDALNNRQRGEVVNELKLIDINFTEQSDYLALDAWVDKGPKAGVLDIGHDPSHVWIGGPLGHDDDHADAKEIF